MPHSIASDGGSNSRFWMQICADVLQEHVQLLVGHPGSCLGAAWVAAIGVELTDDWQGVSRFVTYGDLVSPNKAHAKTYDLGYSRYRQTYEALAALR